MVVVSVVIRFRQAWMGKDGQETARGKSGIGVGVLRNNEPYRLHCHGTRRWD